MSWLYTVIFAGLALSSDGTAVSDTDYSVQNSPVAVESVILDETEKFERSYPLNAGGRVNISNVNGSVRVEAWDRNEVKLEYTKTADTKERLADVEVKIESKPEFFSVETDYGNWKTGGNRDRWRNGGKLNVDFRLTVPRGAVLNEIETVNGSVAVSNFTNITRVSAVNGSVNASNLRGTAKLSTVNGEVTADFDRLESGSKITLETVNGRANLVIPSDANATVRADTLNGNITNDFGLPVRKGKYVGRDLYGRLGNGEVQIRLNSVNGGLSIGRKNDGRTLSPATDLLPQKAKDDEDWDGFELGMVKSAKIDKDVAKAVKAGVKAAADVKVNIGKIQPEIAAITAHTAAIAVQALGQTAQVLNSEEFKQKIQDAARNQGIMRDAVLFPSVPRVEKKSESFPVKGVPTVTVEGKGCSVTVRGWDKSEVQYRVTRFTDPRNGQPIAMSESHTESAVNIKVENASHEARGGLFNGGSRLVRIEVFVPRKSNLKISANGEIRLEGVSGDVELVGSDESINVRDVDGTLRVSNSDGRIRVIGFKGEIDAKTSGGMISLEGDFRKLNAKASEGSIMLTLPENASADLVANCNEVSGEGIVLTRVSGTDGLTRYRIGKGGPTYTIATEGDIRVRGAGTLSESF